jgi:2-beta-glucuronyltransferase
MTHTTDDSVLFITGHSFVEPQRVSIHMLAIAAAERVGTVRLFVAGAGPATLFKAKQIARQPKNAWAEWDGIAEYHAWQWTTPVDLRSPLRNALAGPFFASYGRDFPGPVLDAARAARLILLESGVANPYLSALDRHGLLGKTVYVAADDVRTIRGHPLIRQGLEHHSHQVKGCLSFGAHGDAGDPYFAADKVQVVPKGIDLGAYAVDQPSPYDPDPALTHVVSVGNMLFSNAIVELASQCPTARFHIIGAVGGDFPDNVTLYGVLPFKQTIPFVQHADVGLLPYRWAANMAYLQKSSMKLAQFRAVGLPIVGPDYIGDPGADFCGFDPKSGDSFAAAIAAAKQQGRTPPDARTATDFRQNWAAVEAHFL